MSSNVGVGCTVVVMNEMFIENASVGIVAVKERWVGFSCYRSCNLCVLYKLCTRPRASV